MSIYSLRSRKKTLHYYFCTETSVKSTVKGLGLRSTKVFRGIKGQFYCSSPKDVWHILLMQDR